LRIACGLKMCPVTDCRGQLKCGLCWAFHIAPSAASDTWIADGVSPALLLYIALGNTMQFKFHWPRKTWLTAGLVVTVLHSVRTGWSAPNPKSATFKHVTLGGNATEYEALFQIPQKIWFRICGVRLHLLPCTVRDLRRMKCTRIFTYPYECIASI